MSFIAVGYSEPRIIAQSPALWQLRGDRLQNIYTHQRQTYKIPERHFYFLKKQTGIIFTLDDPLSSLAWASENPMGQIFPWSPRQGGPPNGCIYPNIIHPHVGIFTRINFQSLNPAIHFEVSNAGDGLTSSDKRVLLELLLRLFPLI